MFAWLRGSHPRSLQWLFAFKAAVLEACSGCLPSKLAVVACLRSSLPPNSQWLLAFETPFLESREAASSKLAVVACLRGSLHRNSQVLLAFEAVTLASCSVSLPSRQTSLKRAVVACFEAPFEGAFLEARLPSRKLSSELAVVPFLGGSRPRNLHCLVALEAAFLKIRSS